MEITLTPFMGLTLPSIFTTSSIGTLPQDWALYINSNLVIFDSHDHSEIGKQISSLDLQTSQNLDLGGQNILELNKVIFPTVSGLPETLLSLYSDGTDLFFFTTDPEGVEKHIQITAAGTIPANVDGFFGDYATSGANAAYDGPSNTFQFFGAAGSQNTTVKALQLSAVNLTVDVSTTMSSTMQLNAQSVSLKDPNVNFVNSVLTSQGGGTYLIGAVVGDGSPYETNPPSQSINVPMVDPNQRYLFVQSEVPGPLYGNAQYSAGNQNQETMVFVYESDPIKEIWLPNETAIIPLTMKTNAIPWAIENTSFNIISAKACVVSTAGTLSTYSNFSIFWRLYILKINLDPENTAFSTAQVYFQNLENVQKTFEEGGVRVHFIRLVVKTMFNYGNAAFFGPTS